MKFLGQPRRVSSGFWSVTVMIAGDRYGYLFHESEWPRVRAEMEKK